MEYMRILPKAISRQDRYLSTRIRETDVVSKLAKYIRRVTMSFRIFIRLPKNSIIVTIKRLHYDERNEQCCIFHKKEARYDRL